MERTIKRYHKDVDEKNKDKIRLVLSSGDKDWGALKEGTGLSDSVLSKHLKQLEDKEEISVGIDKKDKRKKIYTINKLGLKAVKKELMALEVYIYLDSRFINLMERVNREELSRMEANEKWFKDIGYLVVTAMSKDKEFLRAFLKGIYFLGIKHKELATEIGLSMTDNNSESDIGKFIQKISTKDLEELKNSVHVGTFQTNKVIDKMISTGDYQQVFGEKPPSRLIGYMEKDTLDAIVEDEPALHYLSRTVNEHIDEREYEMYKEAFRILVENRMLNGVFGGLEEMEKIF